MTLVLFGFLQLVREVSNPSVYDSNISYLNRPVAFAGDEQFIRTSEQFIDNKLAV